MPQLASYQQRLTVTTEHLDQLGHVNNVVYVQWIQDIAATHWKLTAPANLQSHYYWVVTHHSISYLKPCKIGDELTLKTQVMDDIRGAQWGRKVWVEKAEGTAVKATTTWCLINASSNRPARITEEIRKMFISTAT